MTVSTTIASQTFPGNGGQSFPCDFRIFDDTNVDVQLVNDADGTTTTLVLNTDYTISGAGGATGFTLATTNPVAIGYTLTVERVMPYDQPTDFTNQGSFFPSMHEDMADRLEMQIQQVAGKIARSLVSSLATGDYELAGASIFGAPDATKSDGLTTLSQVSQLVAGAAAGIPPADVALYSQLSSSAAGKGSALVAIKRTDTANAVTKAVSDLVNADVIVPVRDFGFDNTGATVNDTALATLLASIQLSVDGRGRRIRFGRGTFKFHSAMAFTAYAAGLVHSIILEGDGPDNTRLDFSGSPANTDGVTFNAGAHFVVRDLSIDNAARDGLVIGAGNTVGGANYCSNFTIENVRVQASTRDGIVLTNAYLGSIRDCWSKSSGRNGVNIQGFSTALKVDRCESSQSGSSGWVINGVVYSEFSACGSDGNTAYGYALSNCQGVKLTACGSESNGRDSFLLFTSTASVGALGSSVQDIHGVVFDSCYALNGSASAAGTYASFIGANTADGRPIDFKIIGGSCYGATASDRALILAGTSGMITCHKELFYDAAMVAADALSGSYEVKNATVTGRRALAVASTNQSITSGVQTTVAFSSLSVNDLGATLSSNAIVIPRGVNKVRVTAGLIWAGSATGSRYVEIDKNGGSFLGLPTNRLAGTSATQSQSIISSVISVVPGDTFSVAVVQDSGGALNINAPANGTFLCVEAVS